MSVLSLREIIRKQKAALLPLFFVSLSACSQSLFFPSDEELRATAGSESAIIFSETLFPVLVDNCSSCHGSNQFPKFAEAANPQGSHDALQVNNETYINFSDPRSSNLVVKVLRGHNCWSGSCSTDALELSNAITTWAERLGTTGSDVRGLATVAVTIPESLVDLNAPPEVLEFALDEISGVDAPPGTRMEVSISRFDEDQYLIAEPRIYTSSTLQVTQFNTYINEKEVEAFAWQTLSAIVNPEEENGFLFTEDAARSILAPLGLGIPEGQERGPGVDSLIFSFDFVGTPQSEQERRFNDFRNLVRDRCANCHSEPQDTGFGAMVGAFGGFSQEFEFLERRYGSYMDGTPRLLVVPGDPENSGLYRAVQHGANNIEYPEYAVDGSADQILGNDVFDGDMPFVGDPGERAQWARIIRDWIEGIEQ